MSQEIMLEMTFDSGHRIVGHKGKCARLHGHTYRAEIWCQGPVDPETGFVVDFGDIKDLVNEWDHRLLLWDSDPVCVTTIMEADNADFGVVRLAFNPTAENMAMDLAKKIQRRFNLEWVRIQLWETPKSMARGQA